MSDFRDIDLGIARARIALSLLAMVSVYVDPTTAGGLFHLSTYALVVLLAHLAYSTTFYFWLRGSASASTLIASLVLDLGFATAVAFLTEGQTSPSYIFFVFAIVAVGIRGEMRATIVVTLGGVSLYSIGIALSDGMTSFYMMRAVYLAIAGYLISFLGQQRSEFETRLREFESQAERHLIARSLHDGYVQSLAGMNLRLETCRQLLMRKRGDDALEELSDLQTAVAREFDSVRVYVRSLAGIEATSNSPPIVISNPRLALHVILSTSATVGEEILQIVLEGLRNARRHANADTVTIDIKGLKEKIMITIDDDGVGFAESQVPPWAIASRVTELGGHLNVINTNRDRAGRLKIEMPNE